MNESSKAVFLSYASQDAEAAKRICEALQAAGVEVWFDQSELVGGDAWDAKIRGQIKACALFVPIVSVNTQARRSKRGHVRNPEFLGSKGPADCAQRAEAEDDGAVSDGAVNPNRRLPSPIFRIPDVTPFGDSACNPWTAAWNRQSLT